jgi:hypothetical protein
MAVYNFCQEMLMGYNRSGKRRTQRLKRAKKEFARLVEKALAKQQQQPQQQATAPPAGQG